MEIESVKRTNRWTILRPIIWLIQRPRTRTNNFVRLEASEPAASTDDIQLNPELEDGGYAASRSNTSRSSGSRTFSFSESFCERWSAMRRQQEDGLREALAEITEQTSVDSFDPISGQMYGYLIDGNVDALFGTIPLDGEVDTAERLSLLAAADNRDTPLHIAASAGQVELLKKLLSVEINLLLRVNSNGDLAVHAAARSCQFKALECLLHQSMEDSSFPDKILRHQNTKQKDTPLHIALKNHDQSMAESLVKIMYPNNFYILNVENMSPLYLAIQAKYWDVVRLMLDMNPADCHAVEELLKKGKSVVHAVISARKKDILRRMLGKCSGLVDTFDEEGRTPLSYAAYIGYLDAVKFFLEKFPGEAFKKGKVDGCFPIHWACKGGQTRVVRELTSSSLMSRDLLNNKGQNILHMAAGNGRAGMVQDLLEDMLKRQKDDQLPQWAINMRDEDGNTPLHLAVINKHPKVVYVMTRYKQVQLSLENKDGCAPLDAALNYTGFNTLIEERLTWLVLTYAGASRSSRSNTLHKKTENPDLDNNYKDRINTLQLMATLVATVTFAAGFTLPGGYNNDPGDNKHSTGDNKNTTGMAVLGHRFTFKAFLISDTIAMYSSILVAVSLVWAQLGDLRLILFSLRLVLPLLRVALTAMSVAFMAGVYLVVADVGWLANFILVAGSIFLALLQLFFIPLYSPPSTSTCIWRHIFYIPLHLMLFMIREKNIDTTM